MSVRAFLYDSDGEDQEVELTPERVAGLTDRHLLWVDVTAPGREELDRLRTVLGLHRESVRTVLNPVGRPRLENFGRYFQINVVAVETVAGEPTDYRAVPLDFFSGPNYVVTVHPDEVTFLRDFRDQVRGDSDIGQLTSAAFLAALLDWHVTSYLRVLDDLEGEVDDLDEAVLRNPADREFLEDLVTLRRRVGRLRRLLAPHREVYAALARPDFTFIAETELGAHFRTLEDRFDRALDSIENARDLVLGSFELYTTGTSQRTNDSVRVLTVVTVLLGLVGAVAGLMGTNFTVEFYKSGTHGFELMLAALAVASLLIVWHARRSRWV
ncbi:magnesium transporter CorA family protein [Deinococcus planocerae]|uniref:magnesium transporter CorA family protein n=1 Tax=Deinococcus planocerae TaxID=1737569 RepID=UPI000C7F1F16|nr:CorA family divalent cation transporter [Deinococcus planocerae]